MAIDDVLKISREEVDELMRLADRIQENLHNCPHLSALKVEAELRTLREMAGDLLPGGYAGPCGHCGAVLGEDEVALSAVDETLYFCAPCAEEYRSACKKLDIEATATAEVQE